MEEIVYNKVWNAVTDSKQAPDILHITSTFNYPLRSKLFSAGASFQRDAQHHDLSSAQHHKPSLILMSWGGRHIVA